MKTERNPETVLPEYPQRLADMLGTLPPTIPDSEEDDSAMHKIASPMIERIDQGIKNGVPIFVIDNVVEYLLNNETNDGADWVSTMPACRPPFDSLWIEWHRPNRPKMENAPQYIGAAVTTVDMKRVHDPKTHEHAIFARLEKESPDFRHEVSNAQWFVTMDIVATDPAGEVLMLCGAAFLFLDELGRYVLPPLTFHSGNENLKTQMAGWLSAMGMALGFLNCANIERVDVEPSNSVARKRLKRGDPPLTKYKILMLDPNTRRSGRGSSAPTGEHNSLHICRGSFAQYGMNGRGLLFGRFSGQVWRPQHQKGRASAGKVEKRYAIKPIEPLAGGKTPHDDPIPIPSAPGANGVPTKPTDTTTAVRKDQ